MKRLLITLTLTCLLPLCADAQWYLFPGNKKKQSNTKEQAKETVIPTTPETAPADTMLAMTDSVSIEEMFVFDRPATIQVSLILPLQANSEKPSGSFLEMYSGALMALKDLGNEGIKVRLKVIDSSSSDLEGDPGLIQDSDVIIGPVSYNNILKTLPHCERHQMLVSPLEPRSAALADSCNVIQAPSPWTSQIDDMICWLEEEIQPGDEVIVLQDNSQNGFGNQGRRVIDQLEQKNIRYRISSSLEGLNIEDNITYRLLIASDSDAFITRSVRSIGISAELKKQVILYTTSRVRNCVDSNVNDLYNANTRLTAAYHIDYNDEAVKQFVLAYRAVFKSEPGSFAFQGYDTMKYFVRMCDEYGRRWHKKLPEKSERGLQSDFEFSKEEGNGHANIAVRRVIYNKDLTTTLL